MKKSKQMQRVQIAAPLIKILCAYKHNRSGWFESSSFAEIRWRTRFESV